MTPRPDAGAGLHRTVCDLYSNLVTRPTGAAVREEIEHAIERVTVPSLTVIDFSKVGLLDFSCADEVLGKLLARHCREVAAAEAYFLVRGARSDHLEAIEAALSRYEMAVLVEVEDGSWHVVGALNEADRRTLQAVCLRGRADLADVAADLDEPADTLAQALDGLWKRRLIIRDGSRYCSLPSAL